ncbi:MAG TPA: LPS assembly protein LptD [Phycisphaerae bacterium]|nr:LPS assembly protein LptD [Phycisphaerae bacterium]
MNDARTRSHTATRRRIAHWALHAAALTACGSIVVGGLNSIALAAPTLREASIIPTVHPTIVPTSAMPVSLDVQADQTSVWRSDLEQRMLATGHVKIQLGYRLLRSDAAAIWLTPSRESGESTWDVAIYLSGNVQVLEGDRPQSTATQRRELLVTTRISRSIDLTGTPVSKAEDNSPIVKRGNELRDDLLNRPMAPIFIPQIQVTSIEQALQAGWIARGPNNKIVAGPGDFQLVKTAEGKYVAAPVPPKPAKPRPILRIAFDPSSEVRAEQVGNEIITVYHGPYIIYDALDGKPPMVFHADRAVTFSPVPKSAETAPAAPLRRSISQYVTGVYLEGDVNIATGQEGKTIGAEDVHAEKIYIDFTSMRAVMLDAAIYTRDEKRNVPLYMRASEIRMLARGEYAAKKANFSTSEFATPHYSIGAGDIYLQDITPRVESPEGAGKEFDPTRSGTAAGPKEYAFKAKDATIDFQGIPIFYWPYLSGDTSNNDIPLRKLKMSNSQTYGFSIETQWDLIALTGQKAPPNFKAALNLDYYTKRGPAGGVDAYWGKNDPDSTQAKDSYGEFRSYVMEDHGTDRLGKNRTDVPVEDSTRGRVLARHQENFGDGWSMNLEAAYNSDPNFLPQYFNGEYETDKEQETDIYVKHQGDTDAVSLLGKFYLYDFTAVADQVDDQFTTEKKPEAKYWRVGDSFLDTFTYYSESGVANLHTMISDYTPDQLALAQSSSVPGFISPPASYLAGNSSKAGNTTFRDYYQQHGFLNDDIFRADSRHELDMPLEIGDLKVSPYVTGRVTAWDDGFNSTTAINPPSTFTKGDGSTTRVWGSTGIRSSMQFWRVYSDVESTFWDVHQLRHVIEPQFNVFATGADESRNDLQPFDRDVEGISRASGTSLALNQKWETKRGGPGHWRSVDWLTLNVQWNNFWDKERAGSFFYPLIPDRGFYFASRPELSLIQNSIAVDGTWRVGERVRILGEGNYDTTDNRLYQIAGGVAVDQTSSLSYFVGTRYEEIPQFGSGATLIPGYTSNQATFAMDYKLTTKYEFIGSESYDFSLGQNILSSFTLVRRMPRLYTALTVTYDANNADTTVSFTASPEGFPELGLGNANPGQVTGKP